jgi:RNA polymerase sigma-54 factor
MIQTFIKEENPQKPLSDSKLMVLLTEQGIEIARRTVAKYREALAIPSSRDRKCLV